MNRRVRVEVLAAVAASFLIAEADGAQELGGLHLALSADKAGYVLGEPGTRHKRQSCTTTASKPTI